MLAVLPAPRPHSASAHPRRGPREGGEGRWGRCREVQGGWEGGGRWERYREVEVGRGRWREVQGGTGRCREVRKVGGGALPQEAGLHRALGGGHSWRDHLPHSPGRPPGASSSLTPCYPGSALSPKGCLSVLEGDGVWGVPWRSPEEGLAPAPVLSYGAGRQGGPLDTVPNHRQLGEDTAAPQMGSWARMFQSTRYW